MPPNNFDGGPGVLITLMGAPGPLKIFYGGPNPLITLIGVPEPPINFDWGPCPLITLRVVLKIFMGVLIP